ncbi:MAG: transcription termination/antitermination protein NusA, partial [Cyanobacteria bacterium P01_H01_bin.15]
EKIDVIRWSPDPAIYIANALSPARIDNVVLEDAEERQSTVIVPEDQLSLAIGKEGQNVRLAARLTGWKIDIKDRDRYEREKAEQAAARAAAPAIDEDLMPLKDSLEAGEKTIIDSSKFEPDEFEFETPDEATLEDLRSPSANDLPLADNENLDV